MPPWGEALCVELGVAEALTVLVTTSVTVDMMGGWAVFKLGAYSGTPRRGEEIERRRVVGNQALWLFNSMLQGTENP